MTKDVRLIIEQHPDGFVAYPVGLRGVIIGEGDTREEAVADVTSAIQFHVETFGTTELGLDAPLLDVFLVNTQVAVRQLREFRRGITLGGSSIREMIEEGRRS